MPITRESIKAFEAEQKEALELFCKDLGVAMSDGSPMELSEQELEEYRAWALRYAYIHQCQISHALRTLFTEVQEQLFPGNPMPWVKDIDQKEESEGERTETQG